jgi:tetratricopeptide (TPR) repeat protein
MDYAEVAEQANPQEDHLPRAHALLAELEVLRGRAGQALAWLEPLLDQPDRLSRVGILVPLAWARLELGDLGAAQEAVQMATAAVDVAHPTETNLGVNDAHLFTDALRMRGMILAREGKREGAEQAFVEAVTMAQPMPYPYAEARALCEWGRMLVDVGELERARSRLEEALAIFERLGARPYVERTHRALRAVSAPR